MVNGDTAADDLLWLILMLQKKVMMTVIALNHILIDCQLHRYIILTYFLGLIFL